MANTTPQGSITDLERQSYTTVAGGQIAKVVTSFPSSSSLPSTFTTGVITLTGVAQRLPNVAATMYIEIHSLSSNQGIEYYGSSSGVTSATGMAIEVGQPKIVPVDNAQDIYVIGTVGDKITYAIY